MAQQCRTHSERQRLIEEYKGSGLTQQQFADSRGISRKALENWMYRLRRKARKSAESVQFLPVRVRKQAPKTAGRVAGERVEIQCGASLRVRFAVGVDCDYLGRLLSTLARSVAC